MKEIVSIQFGKDQGPLYLQLYNHIKRLIVDKTFEIGDKLPPIRKVASQLQVNTVTVVSAYKLLEQNDYVYAKKGSGTYVADIKEVEEYMESQRELESSIHQNAENPKDVAGIALMTGGHIHIEKDSINFASATPTPAFFPVEDFKQVLMQVLDRDGGKAFGYDESNGYGALRAAIVSWLKTDYQIESHAQNIQIISGAQQGIDIIAKAFVNPGDYVLVENPTYTGAVAVFKSRGAKVVGVPIQRDGIDMEKLEKYIRIYRPKLIYTMPHYQNPTTFCYSDDKKVDLLKLVKDKKIYIIEDDFMSDLNFEKKYRTKTLKSMDQYHKVLYIKSFSKVLMPGIRLGFLAAPLMLFKQIMQAKHTSDIASSGLIQRAFHLYLKKGFWNKHLMHMKEVYYSRYVEIMKLLLEVEKMGGDVCKANGGLNIWVKLPEGVSGTALYQRCLEKKVLIVPGKIFYVGENKAQDNYIRLSYAATDIQQIKVGINKLCNCIQMLQNQDESDVYYSPLI